MATGKIQIQSVNAVEEVLFDGHATVQQVQHFASAYRNMVICVTGLSTKATGTFINNYK